MIRSSPLTSRYRPQPLLNRKERENKIYLSLSAHRNTFCQRAGLKVCTKTCPLSFQWLLFFFRQKEVAIEIYVMFNTMWCLRDCLTQDCRVRCKVSTWCLLESSYLSELSLDISQDGLRLTCTHNIPSSLLASQSDCLNISQEGFALNELYT